MHMFDMWLCVYVCTCVRLYACVSLCVSVCLHVCACVRLFVFVYTCVYTCVWILPVFSVVVVFLIVQRRILMTPSKTTRTRT